MANGKLMLIFLGLLAALHTGTAVAGMFDDLRKRLPPITLTSPVGLAQPPAERKPKILTMHVDCVAQDGGHVFAMFMTQPAGASVVEGDIVIASASYCKMVVQRGVNSLTSATIKVQGSNPVEIPGLPYKFLITGIKIDISKSSSIKQCLDLKAEIAEKLKMNGVRAYTLTVIQNGDTFVGQVVGSCEVGSKKVIYKRT